MDFTGMKWSIWSILVSRIKLFANMNFDFRDEHLDFKEEMKRIAALKGKTGRTVGGSGGKRAKLQGKK